MASNDPKFQISVNAITGGGRDRYGDRVRQTSLGNFTIHGNDLTALMAQAASHLGLFTAPDEDAKTELTVQVYDMRNEGMGSVQLLSVTLSESPFSAAVASAKAHLALVPVPAESK